MPVCRLIKTWLPNKQLPLKPAVCSVLLRRWGSGLIRASLPAPYRALCIKLSWTSRSNRVIWMLLHYIELECSQKRQNKRSACSSAICFSANYSASCLLMFQPCHFCLGGIWIPAPQHRRAGEKAVLRVTIPWLHTATRQFMRLCENCALKWMWSGILNKRCSITSQAQQLPQGLDLWAGQWDMQRWWPINSWQNPLPNQLTN